jgi:hypothetical protein
MTTNNPTSLIPNAAHTKPQTGQIQLTRWTASHPVTKHLGLAPDGSIEKLSSANKLYDGDVRQVSVEPKAFCKFLQQLSPNDCLSYGIPLSSEAVRVMSRKYYEKQGHPRGATTRTLEHMAWPNTGAIMMLDHDPHGNKYFSKDSLLDAIYKVCPSIERSGHVWWCSASSSLYHEDTGVEIQGIAGQRIYIFVADGRDIPRAGAVLFKRLWLAGHGYIKISSAGSLLPRTIVDGMVWQPNRIDYVATPICKPPLQSRKPQPLLLGDATLVLDSVSALPNLAPDEEAKYQLLLSSARAASEPAASTIRSSYIEKHVKKMVDSGVDPEVARKTMTMALEDGVLYGDFELRSSDGSTVTVRDLLADPANWHKKTFADPLEPDYHDDHRIATAYLLGVARPTIRSFAHGGRHYRLALQTDTIRIAKGERGVYVRRASEILASGEHAFLRGASLIQVSDAGKIQIINDLGMLKLLDQTIRFEQWNGRLWIPADARLEWSRMLIGPYAGNFKPLNAVLSAPIIWPTTGEVLSAPGYNSEHQLYLSSAENFYDVPSHPTHEDITCALQTLWWPVHQFPFVGAVDQSVMLSAMLTAVNRKAIPIVPAFGLDAPVQGSGKTLLLQMLCVLSGETPTVSPPPDSGNDEEMRKRLFACAREGATTIVIDNIVGNFDSPALASMLTTTLYKDRVLGESRTDEVPNNSIVLLSGNNLTLTGELPRRVFICRIDPKVELPHQRSFDFDPVQVVKEFRQELVAAALTLMRAYLMQKGDKRPGPGRLASFEEWDDLVRQTVCWLAELQKAGVIPAPRQPCDAVPVLVDPMEAINEVIKHDPIRDRHGRLLREITMKFGAGTANGNMFSTALIIKKASLDLHQNFHTILDDNESDDNLNDLLVEVAGDPIRGKVNPRSLGKYFAKHADRIVDGLCLRRGGSRQNVLLWYVEDTSGELSGFGGLVSSHAGAKSPTRKKKVAKEKQPTKPTIPTTARKKFPPTAKTKSGD